MKGTVTCLCTSRYVISGLAAGDRPGKKLIYDKATLHLTLYCLPLTDLLSLFPILPTIQSLK